MLGTYLGTLTIGHQYDDYDYDSRSRRSTILGNELGNQLVNSWATLVWATIGHHLVGQPTWATDFWAPV